MCNLTRRALIFSAAAAGAGVLGPAQAATGSVYIKIFSAGFIIGFSGGEGVLQFAGQRYPLKAGGVSAGALAGIAAAEFVGTASNLTVPADIEGIYTAVSAGLAVAGGGSVAALSNSHGVMLRLKARRVGFMVAIDLSGLSISLA